MSNQGSPTNGKEPPIGDYAASWIKLKTGPFLSSNQMSHVGKKKDVVLTAKLMKTTFPGVVDHEETVGEGDVGEGAIANAIERGMGRMKLEAPPRFKGKRPRVCEWLVNIWRLMQLMWYPSKDWIDTMATRCEWAASTWMNLKM